jgi:hypothetical protein
MTTAKTIPGETLQPVRPARADPVPAAGRPVSCWMKPLAWLLAAAVLAVASGCAHSDWIEATLVTVDVTGTWSGSAASPGTSTLELWLELVQQGPKVTGSLRTSGSFRLNANQTVPLEGTVTGDVFRFRPVNTTGWSEMIVGEDEMKGRLSSSPPITLRRVTSPSPARSDKP